MSTKKMNMSPLVFGAWRLADDTLEAHPDSVARKIMLALEHGITTFDHADIYGNYTCEKLFGDAMAKHSIPRSKLQLIGKCGIKLVSNNRPQHTLKTYETTRTHIVQSVENSLRNLRTDYLDMLLIHRPDPLMRPDEINDTFQLLQTQGKVKAFGVSNFLPSQVRMLQTCVSVPLVTNQIEFSLLNTSAMHNGQLDQCLETGMIPMAWSPLAGGRLFSQNNDQAQRTRSCLTELAKKYKVTHPETIAYAWLLKHPSKVVPVLGTGKEERLKAAVAALTITLEHDDWFQLLQASTGHEVP